MRRPISEVRQSYIRQMYVAKQLVYAEHLQLTAIALRGLAFELNRARTIPELEKLTNG